eukprot:TRINITY_DN3344_c0_g1_i1.p1 TRINITY_DN3344_c0_g1~~TRINITY_DN3344_c0_g1_i1.p1  ORF type:complete len:124 (-),score=27.22 TRINITY_DN3344_c0_g1_i1:70-441(-)
MGCGQMIHTALLVEYAQKFARGHPLVVAGDFNIKPHDAMYKLIRDGTIPSDHPHWPKGPSNWAISPMQSAYAITGGEPEFTNFAKTGKEPFCEVLDYIWLSSEWKVASAVSYTHLTLPTIYSV